MYHTTIDPTAAVNDPALAPYFTGPALQQVLTSPEGSPDLEVRAVFFWPGSPQSMASSSISTDSTRAFRGGSGEYRQH
jgi:hypothetical protein